MCFHPRSFEFGPSPKRYLRSRDIQLFNTADYGWTVLEMTDSSGCFVLQHPDYDVALAEFRREIAAHYKPGARVRAKTRDHKIEINHIGSNRYEVLREATGKRDRWVDDWSGSAWLFFYCFEGLIKASAGAGIYLHLGADDGAA